MASVKVVVSGFGRFGRLHAEIVRDHPAALVAGVAEPSEEARQEAARLYPDANVAADLDEVLAAVEPDCCLVVSDEGAHAGNARACFERGIPVFSEKPLATTLEEARDLVQTARERAIYYQAGYILRYETRHVILHDHIRQGRLGPPALIRTKRNCSRQWFLDYGFRVHPVYETLIHDIDLVLWLTSDRCAAVSAWERATLGKPTPDTTLAVLELTAGTLALLETCWLVPQGTPPNVLGWGATDGVIDAELEVLGPRGSASIDTHEASLSIRDDVAVRWPDASLWPGTPTGPGGALREELWDFLACIVEKRGSAVASIDEALHVQEIADAIVKASRTERRVKVSA